LKNIEIETDRFLLKCLNTSHATEKYLGWFSDSDSKKYIAAASSSLSIEDLKNFIKEREDREDVLFLGIFDKSSKVHIGNIKYEPIDPEKNYAIMGILIGDSFYRGKGVSSEVIKATADWLKTNKNIHQILLGVHKKNLQAIRAYEKVGFIVTESEYLPVKFDYTLTMKLSI